MSVSLTGSFDPSWLERFEGNLLDELADRTRDHAKTSLGSPGPQAPSEPGETPNRQTDDLYSHIESVRVGPHESATESTRPSGDDRVPEWLENGTPGGRMAARPYMRPAYERTLTEFADVVEEAKRRT